MNSLLAIHLNGTREFVLQKHILMGDNLNIILTRISPYKLLESIMGKLKNPKRTTLKIMELN